MSKIPQDVQHYLPGDSGDLAFTFAYCLNGVFQFAKTCIFRIFRLLADEVGDTGWEFGDMK